MHSTWIVPLVLSGCFQVDLTSGRFGCDRDTDCPSGLVCLRTSAGLRCVDPSEPVAPPPGQDLSMPGPDLALEDMGAEDLAQATPDLTVDNGPCLGSGTRLADVGVPRGLRGGSGRDPVQGERLPHLRGGGSAGRLGRCSTVTGFYASQVPIENVEAEDMTAFQIDCDIGINVDPGWGLIGCGLQMGIRPKGTTTGICPPLPHVMRCTNSSGWTCAVAPAARGTLRAMSHSMAATLGGGVLCCRNR